MRPDDPNLPLLRAVPQAVRSAIAESFADLLRHPDFLNALPGLIAEPDRTPIVAARLRDLSA